MSRERARAGSAEEGAGGGRGTTQLRFLGTGGAGGCGSPPYLVSPKRKQGEDLSRPDKAVASHKT